MINHSIFSAEHPVSQKKPAVLIVGAGPAGLSAAKALQNIGIYPDIIEKEDRIRSDGAGIAIPANGSWALDRLGIDISSEAYPIDKMQFTDHLGDVLVQEEISGIHPEGAGFYSISRNEMMTHLLSALDQNIRIQTAISIQDFSEEHDRVKVEFSNGRIGFYDLVIGCDGVRSSLRQKVHPDEAPEFLGLLTWRTVIDAPDEIAMPTYMLGNDNLCLLYPMPNRELYVYAQLFQSVKGIPSETFSDLFSSFGGAVPEVIRRIERQNFDSERENCYIRHLEKSHSVRFKLSGFGRILLIGDAAHAFGPMLQNGAAQAFEDAYVIQELLREGAEDIPSFIDAFEKRRFTRVDRVFSLSNDKIRAIVDPKQVQGRNEAIRTSGAPNVNGFKELMLKNP